MGNTALSRGGSKRSKADTAAQKLPPGSLLPPAPTQRRTEDPVDPAPAKGPRPSACLLRRVGDLDGIVLTLKIYFEGPLFLVPDLGERRADR